MAREEASDRLRQDSQQREAREARRSYHARIEGALELGGAILDKRLNRPELVLPKIIEYLTPLADTGKQVSDYDTKSVGQALLIKAMGGKVEKVQVDQLKTIDRSLDVMEANPLVQSALRKYDEFELLGQGDEQPDLTPDELNEFAKYNTELGNKAWLLDYMTDGVAGMVAERDAATARARRLGVQKEILESKGLGDLSAEEQKRYNGYLDKMFAKLRPNELKDYERLTSVPVDQLSRGEVAVLNGMVTKMMTGLDWVEHEDVDYKHLKEHASKLSDKEEVMLGLVDAKIASLQNRANELQDLIEAKAELLGADNEWMKLYKAYNGMVDNMNVTAQWRIAWHDLGAGAVDNFTQTRWAEYQKTSDLVALMELPGVGEAMQKGFQAISRLALNKGIVVGGAPYNRNIFQEKELTSQATDEFFGKVKQFVQEGSGGKMQDIYAEFGVEMARMLFENSLLSGWCCVPRDNNGEIIYGLTSIGGDGKLKTVGPGSSDFRSEQYMQGAPLSLGDGSAYADRSNDYVKVAATRAKLMNEAVNTFPTGLPAILPVAPDWLRDPWISHEQLTDIANGRIDLVQAFKGGYADHSGKSIDPRAENSRWFWAYTLFRSAQIYDTISKFVVGLKGFRGIAEEVEFFLKSPSNLADLNKKSGVGLGTLSKVSNAPDSIPDGSVEQQRFNANFAMSMLYAVWPKFSNAGQVEELKTVLPSDSEGKVLTWVNFEKDDFRRVFVRNGFFTDKVWSAIWKRMVQIDAGTGGKWGAGMLKKGETSFPYLNRSDINEAKRVRRKNMAKSV